MNKRIKKKIEKRKREARKEKMKRLSEPMKRYLEKAPWGALRSAMVGSWIAASMYNNYKSRR